MQIRPITEDQPYKKEVVITFQSKREADAFFSLFNCARVTDKFEELTGSPCKLYEGAHAIGASNHRYFHHWNDILK